jgi:uncharacterized protein (TIGR02996 family)
MRTFRLLTLFEDRFWNITNQGRSLTWESGKAGEPRVPITDEFASEAEAQAECERLIALLLAEGYKETTATTQPPAPAMPSLQKALEDVIVADPDDLAAHQAYADWLTEQGNPRGEFIRIHLALEELPPDSEQTCALYRRAGDLLAEHESTWLGELARALRSVLTETEPRFRFVRGWLDELHLPFLTIANARLLAASPRLRLVRQLTVHEAEQERAETADDDQAEGEGVFALDVLLASNYLRNVRRLRLLDFNYQFNDHTELLRRSLHPFTLPRLEHLAIGYPRRNRPIPSGWLCQQLLRCPELGRIRRLELWNLDPSDGGVGALLNSSVLRNLEVFDWRGEAMPQELTGELRQRGILWTERHPGSQRQAGR